MMLLVTLCECALLIVSEAIHYFIPSLVAIVRGIKSLMRIGFVHYNCLGFGLASDYSDIVLNTV